jgi:hypothetical protein
MPKKPKVKNIAKPAKKAPDEHKVVFALKQALGELSNRIERAEAIRLGKHQARAELLAPTLKALTKAAATDGTEEAEFAVVCLNTTDCALLLACLSEAGYMPQQERGPLVWQVVSPTKAAPPAACEAPGRDPAANPHPVAKAA